jgi:acyl-CoA synthetase (NDP forming)
MMVDSLAKLGLTIPATSADTKNKLAFLPEICGRNNPVDLTAEADPDHYRKVLEVTQESDDFDVLVALFVPPAFVKSEPISDVVVDVHRTASKPIVACWMSGDLVTEGVKILERGNVPNFPTPKRAAKAVSALVERGRYLAQMHASVSQ